MPRTLSQEQFEKIRNRLPVQRGNVTISNLRLLNAVLYVVENGCKWRGLPPSFGNWHTVYTRLRRWQRNGVLARVFAALQEQQLLAVRLEVLGLDSTSVKVHPDGAGALKKTARKPSVARVADAPPRFIWLPQMSERP
jgi:transposase